MIAIEVLRETETGGIKSYTTERVIYAISHETRSRVVDIGGALNEVLVRVVISPYELETGRIVRCDGREYQVTNNKLVGMAGMRRYELMEVNTT